MISNSGPNIFAWGLKPIILSAVRLPYICMLLKCTLSTPVFRPGIESRVQTGHLNISLSRRQRMVLHKLDRKFVCETSQEQPI